MLTEYHFKGGAKNIMKRFHYKGNFIIDSFDIDLLFVLENGEYVKFKTNNDYADFLFDLQYLRESVRLKKCCNDIGFISDEAGNHRIIVYSNSHCCIFKALIDGGMWIEENTTGIFASIQPLDIFAKINATVIRTRFYGIIDELEISNVVSVFDNAIIFEKNKIKYVMYID